MFSSRQINFLTAGLALLAMGGSACTDSLVDECFQKVGNPLTVEMSLKSFSHLEIHDDIEVELVEGGEQKVELITHEGLLPNVVFSEIENGYLVENTASCKWTRNYARPKLRIAAPGLALLVHKSASPLYSRDTVRFNSLWLAVHQSYSEIDLLLRSNSLVVRHYGKSNVKVSGRAGYADILIIEQVSKIDCSELVSNVVVVDHGGLNTVDVFPLDTLRGGVSNTGNLVVHNRPASVDVQVSGPGQLIFKNH